MAEDTNAEVRLKLVADDGTSETTAKLQAGMKELSEHLDRVNAAYREMAKSGGDAAKKTHEETDKAKKGAGDLAGEVLKGNIQFELAKKGAELLKDVVVEVVSSMKEVGDMAIEAAANEEKQIRAMSGVLQMVDAGAHGYTEILHYTEELHEELEKNARMAGVSADAMSDAFTQVEQHTTKSSEEVKELTLAMANVGKMTAGGLGGLSQGFTMMEMGMIKARNPIVQLIASTHLLKGNAHAVAAQLQKMAPEQAMALGEQAIMKMNEQMRKAGGGKPMQLEQLKESFKGEKDMFFESMGKPMLDKLLPPLNQLKDFLIANEETISQFADKLGKTFGDVISFVDNAIEGIYAGIHDNWDSIQKNFDEIFGDWRAAWDYAATNSDGIKVEFKDITKNLIDTFTEISRYLKAAAEVAMDAYDLASGKNVGTTQAKTAGAAVLGKVTDVSQKAGDFDLTAAKYRQLALDSGAAANEVDNWISHMRDLHEQNLSDAEKMSESVKHGEYETVSAYLDSAIKANSDSAQKYAFSMIAQSEDAKRALIQGGIHIAGGMEALMNIIKDKSPELARQLGNAMNPIKAQGGIKPQGPVVNFNGGQTFHIKQDFKDQDPDRVAFVFRRDVVRSAEARRQSRMGTPFGL